LASDAATAALNDPAVTRLDIQEGGVSPWKGDQVLWLPYLSLKPEASFERWVCLCLSRVSSFIGKAVKFGILSQSLTALLADGCFIVQIIRARF